MCAESDRSTLSTEKTVGRFARYKFEVSILSVSFYKLQSSHYFCCRCNCPVLLAVVLPLSQYVEFNPTNSRSTRADDCIQLAGRTFEEQADSFVKTLLQPAG